LKKIICKKQAIFKQFNSSKELLIDDSLPGKTGRKEKGNRRKNGNTRLLWLQFSYHN